jgi:hypothetical protein
MKLVATQHRSGAKESQATLCSSTQVLKDNFIGKGIEEEEYA